MIRHGQRIAVLAVAGPELAFEVGGPHLIRMVGVDRGRPRVRPPVPAPVLPEQIVAVENLVDGCCGPATAASGADSGAPAGASWPPSHTPGAPRR